MSKRQTGRQWRVLAVSMLLAVCGAQAAEADGGADGMRARSLVVDARGLDLDTAAGVAALYDRLRRAAEAVCELQEAHGYAPRHRARRCVGSALEAAVAGTGTRALKVHHNVAARVVRRSPEEALPPLSAAVRP